MSDALPRYRLRSAYESVGLEPTRLRPASDDQLRRAGVSRLLTAAAASFAVGPALHGKRAQVMLAKRAVSQLAARAGLSPADVAWALDQPRRSILRLGSPMLDDGQLKAVRLMIALQDAVADATAFQRIA